MGGGWGQRLNLPTTDRVSYPLRAVAGNILRIHGRRGNRQLRTRGQEGPCKSINGIQRLRHQPIRLTAESASEDKSSKLCAVYQSGHYKWRKAQAFMVSDLELLFHSLLSFLCFDDRQCHLESCHIPPHLLLLHLLQPADALSVLAHRGADHYWAVISDHELQRPVANPRGERRLLPSAASSMLAYARREVDCGAASSAVVLPSH